MPRLTKTYCTNIQPPATGRLTIKDSDCTGFQLRVTPNGIKTFVLYKKVAGRPARVTLGRFPEVAPETARKKAIALIGQVAAGGSIKPTKERAKTIRDAITHALANHYSRQKGGGREALAFLNYTPRLQSKRLSEVTRQDVVTTHARLGAERGRVTANRWLAYLKSIINIAIRDLGFAGPNPADKVPKFPERSRERFLSPDEMGRLLTALKSAGNRDAADFLQLLLFVGCRKGNLYSARWKNIDLETAVWTIPAAESKSGQSIRLPLAPAAIEILKSRQNATEYVFPGKTRGHAKDLRKPITAIFQAAGIEDVTIHDMRRTMGSWQAAAGTSELVIAKSLGHTSTDATKVYARLDLEPVRRSVEAAVSAMKSTQPHA